MLKLRNAKARNVSEFVEGCAVVCVPLYVWFEPSKNHTGKTVWQV